MVNLLIARGVDPHHIRVPRSSQIDLRRQHDVSKAVRGANVVIHLAARVRGIGFLSQFPASVFHDNLLMGSYVIEESRKAGIEKLVLVGTVNSYPANAPAPLKEDDLWNGYPEDSVASYGLAKRMLFAMAGAYWSQYQLNVVCVILPNLYGPGDHFTVPDARLVPALIARFIGATKEGQVVIWGSGRQIRDLLFIDDAAEGILLATERANNPSPINLGTGVGTSLSELADQIGRATNFKGRILWDPSKPEGRLSGTLDNSRASRLLGYNPKTTLEKGLAQTIEWYYANS